LTCHQHQNNNNNNFKKKTTKTIATNENKIKIGGWKNFFTNFLYKTLVEWKLNTELGYHNVKTNKEENNESFQTKQKNNKCFDEML
jgi:hypothetical protein